MIALALAGLSPALARSGISLGSSIDAPTAFSLTGQIKVRPTEAPPRGR